MNAKSNFKFSSAGWPVWSAMARIGNAGIGIHKQWIVLLCWAYHRWLLLLTLSKFRIPRLQVILQAGGRVIKRWQGEVGIDQ